MVADARDPGTAYAVNDNFYDESRIYTLDLNAEPARITGYRTLTRDGEPAAYDLEGIARREGGGFWLVSEGDPEEGVRNLLIEAGSDGRVRREITLPAAVQAQAIGNGFEGVASWPSADGERVIVAFQRSWKDDPAHHAKLGIYDPATAAWTFVHYPLDEPHSERGGWVGLSEITHVDGARFTLIERDNQPGAYAAHKVLTTIDLADVEPRPAGADLPVVDKHVAVDLLERQRARNGWIADKPEGLALTRDGALHLVVDNDGVQDAPGETQLLEIGTLGDL